MKRQKKKILKIHIEYQSSIYPSLICGITSINTQQLVKTKTLTHQLRCTINLPNQHISNLNIKFYTVGCYEQLLEYHFSEEELMRGEGVIQKTQYYCRIKKQDIKDCIIVFDFVYEVVEELGINKLQTKLQAITNPNNADNNKSNYTQNKKYDLLNSSDYSHKLKQALGIVQCHQIAKKTTTQLFNKAIADYFEQKQKQAQRIRQKKQRQQEQRARMQQMILQRKQKWKHKNSFHNMNAHNPHTTNIHIKSINNFGNKLMDSSPKFITNNNMNVNLHNQIKKNKNQFILKSQQKLEKIIKNIHHNGNMKKKRITIEQTLDNISVLSAENLSAVGGMEAKKQCKKIKWHFLQKQKNKKQLSQLSPEQQQQSIPEHPHKVTHLKIKQPFQPIQIQPTTHSTNRKTNRTNIPNRITRNLYQDSQAKQNIKQRYTYTHTLVSCKQKMILSPPSKSYKKPYLNFQKLTQQNLHRLSHKTCRQENVQQEQQNFSNQYSHLYLRPNEISALEQQYTKSKQKQKQINAKSSRIKQIKNIYIKKQQTGVYKIQPIKVYRFKAFTNRDPSININKQKQKDKFDSNISKNQTSKQNYKNCCLNLAINKKQKDNFQVKVKGKSGGSKKVCFRVRI